MQRGCIFYRSCIFSDTILFAVLFPHDWSWRRKTAAVTGGFLGIQDGLFVIMIGLFLGALLVSGAYVERQKLWTAYGVFASLCRESDGTENLFQLR